MQLGISFGSIFSFLSKLEKSPTPCPQHAKKVVSNISRLVNSAIAIVNSLPNLLKGQVKFWGEFKLQESTINHALKKFREKG